MHIVRTLPVLRLVVVVLPVLLLPAEAQAQAPKPGARKPPLPLSRVELRKCIQREDELTQRQGELERAQVQHDSELAALSQEARALADVLRTLDTNDEAAVDAYNRRNDARNAVVERVNRRALALNDTLATLQADNADYMDTCASRPYRLSDEEAVLKELGRPARPARTTPRPRPRDPRPNEA